MDETISIIVPVYHAENFIIETMDCIRHQTYSQWELLLVVDGPNEKAIPIIQEYCKKHQEDRIKLFIQEGNHGAAKARNRGLLEAEGRFISYIDADDLWSPTKLEAQLKFMREKKCGFSFTSYEFGDEFAKGTGKVVHVPKTLTYKQALKNTTIFTSTVMFDTKKIEKSLLEMPIIKSEDTALWWKILRNNILAYGLDENLVIYRRPLTSLSSDKIEAIRRIWNLYRNAEGLSMIQSMYYLCFWAVRAVLRRV